MKKLITQGFKPLWRGGRNALLAKLSAFTLAEVLITLGIIGVVAAMTIPTLVANYQQRSLDTAANTFNRKLGEALRVMNVQATLAGHNTTQEFVNELGQHIKIVKTCPSDKLKDCFISEFSTNDKTYKTEELKEAKNLNKDGNYGTETIGVQFADGVTALIAYNKNAKQDPYNNSPGRDAIVGITSSGEGKDRSIGLSTDALAILYDVNASSNPNTYTNKKDLRGINIVLSTKICTAELSDGTCLYDMGTSYNIVDCSNSSSKGYEYCNDDDIRISQDYENINGWVGAKYACAKQGMKLPTKDELLALYAKKDEEGITSSDIFWSSTEDGADTAYFVDLEYGYAISDTKDFKFSVMCIGN